MPDAYLFDFDFTLADAGRPIVACFHHALGALGVPIPPEDEIRATIGMSLESAFLSMGGAPGEVLSFRTLFRERANEIMTAQTILLPGVAETLSRLHESGKRIGIVSSKYRYRIVETLEKFAITPFVDCIIGFEDVSAPKPDPEGIRLALRKLGVAGKDSVYVGDSVIDAETAQAAGIAFFGVTTGTTSREALAAYPHQKILSGLNEL